MSYAVVWRENEDAGYSGRLEFGADRIVLSGSRGGWHRMRRELPFDDVQSASFERRTAGRATPQPVLVLATRSRLRIEIASLDGLGALHELAGRVESARGKAAA